MLQVLDFWFGEIGVDGLRLDAVPYLFEREGSNCENLPETHAALKDVRRHVDANYPDKMLLAEANQWPEDVRPYFGDGDECHMAFHFPLMPRLFMALRQADSRGKVVNPASRVSTAANTSRMEKPMATPTRTCCTAIQTPSADMMGTAVEFYYQPPGSGALSPGRGGRRVPPAAVPS